MADRIEMQLATISTLIAGFGGSKLKQKDFMISHKVAPKLSEKQKNESIKAMFKSIM